MNLKLQNNPKTHTTGLNKNKYNSTQAHPYNP
jgi:hypothetical protein